MELTSGYCQVLRNDQILQTYEKYREKRRINICFMFQYSIINEISNNKSYAILRGSKPRCPIF